jgi:DNA-binding CsgD family transcriptional regulator
LRQPLFQRSLDPILICDASRRCVDVNIAACLFLRSPRERLLRSRIDALAPPELRSVWDARWPSFAAPGTPSRLSAVTDELAMPDGTRVAATLSVASIDRDRQLVVIGFATTRARTGDADGPSSSAGRALTERERQVLTLVALGNTGPEIAAELYLSPATVQSHVNNALLKLNARNRSHGIAIAMSTGEIDVGVPLGERSSPFSRPRMPL